MDSLKTPLLLPSESYVCTYFYLGEHFRLHLCAFYQHQTIAVLFWLSIKINDGFMPPKWKIILHHTALLKKTMPLEHLQETVLIGGQTKVTPMQSINFQLINFFASAVKTHFCLKHTHLPIAKSHVHAALDMSGDNSTWRTSEKAAFLFLDNVAPENLVRTEIVWCHPVAYETIHTTQFKPTKINDFAYTNVKKIISKETEIALIDFMRWKKNRLASSLASPSNQNLQEDLKKSGLFLTDLELLLKNAVAEVRDSLERSQIGKFISSKEIEKMHNFKSRKQSIAAIESVDRWATSYLKDVTNQYEEKHKSYGLCYVVVKHPMSIVTSGITIRKQEQLDELGARDFRDAVMYSLTVQEREALMRLEKQRLRTFEIGWPHESYLPGALMARVGFFYLNDSDKVQCAFCRGVLHKWRSHDRPMQEHLRRFSNCKLARGLPCGNIPYYSHGEPLTGEILKNIKLTDSNLLENANAAVELGINMQKACKPEHANEIERRQTFARFPTTCPVPAEKICRAGFYYTQFDDSVRCFWCEGGLENWERGDDPWHEHEKNFPTCFFMKASKESGNFNYADTLVDATAQSHSAPSRSARVGHTNYAETAMPANSTGNEVTDNIRRNPFSVTEEMLDALRALDVEPSTASPSPATNTDTELPTEQFQCKSCRINQPSHIGLPCGCLILCNDCANQNRLHLPCPRCDSKLNGLMKVYCG